MSGNGEALALSVGRGQGWVWGRFLISRQGKHGHWVINETRGDALRRYTTAYARTRIYTVIEHGQACGTKKG
jgi:hypothetical protein